tara:strand:- start:122 stop:745 length:624 start_codon:yes stop_codon:yes gene_type:complete
MTKRDNFGDSVTEQDELSIKAKFANGVCDPLAGGCLTAWESAITNSEHGSATVKDIIDGRDASVKNACIDIKHFTGSFLEELAVVWGDSSAIPSKVLFSVVTMAEGSMLIGDGEQAGEGIAISVLLEDTIHSSLQGKSVTMTEWRNVGWVKPDRVPHNLTAVEFVREICGFQQTFQELDAEARKSIIPELVLDDEKKQAYRDHIASC